MLISEETIFRFSLWMYQKYELQTELSIQTRAGENDFFNFYKYIEKCNNSAYHE